MHKVVVDTNLLVRGAMGGTDTAKILDAWRDGKIALVVSEELLAELTDVLSRPALRKRIPENDALEFIRLLGERAIHVAPEVNLTLCRDPKDDFLLEIAAEAKANYLLTSDNDLLDDIALKQRMQDDFGVAIISLVEFNQLLTD